mgnify:CR=1 FL=1
MPGVSLGDGVSKIIKDFRHPDNGKFSKCIVFKMLRDVERREWIVEKQSDGSKSPKEQFNDVRRIFHTLTYLQ